MRIIAEAIAAKKTQKRPDPWNLSLSVWKILTREQQKLWSDLREASRESTKSNNLATPDPSNAHVHPDEPAAQPKKDPTKRANHATLKNGEDDDLNLPISTEGMASPSTEQAAFENDNLNDEQKSG